MRKKTSIWAIFDDPVVQGVAFALWGVPLYFVLDLPTFTSADQTNIAAFIEWFGVPYGLILALVLVNVWTQFDAADRAFDREADSVLTLHNTLLLISSKSLKIEFGEKLKSYVKLVRRFYFENQENTKTINYQPEVTEESLLKDIRNMIGQLLHDEKDHGLALELLRLINWLVDNRGDRVSRARQRLPLPIRYLSFVASIAWIVPFYSLEFSRREVGAFFISVVTIVVVSILLIIVDLDNPIGGAWGVQLDSWEELEKEIEKEHNLLIQANK